MHRSILTCCEMLIAYPSLLFSGWCQIIFIPLKTIIIIIIHMHQNNCSTCIFEASLRSHKLIGSTRTGACSQVDHLQETWEEKVS